MDYPSENINTFDMGRFARDMNDLVSKNAMDPDLHPWIMPAFSTTTDNDRVVASVTMMGALQKYFSYGCRTAGHSGVLPSLCTALHKLLLLWRHIL